jgi:hypothetical protein
MLNKFWKDALERIAWTTLAAAIPAAAYYVDLLPPQWIPVATVLITVVKTVVAGHVGNPDTAKFDKEN